jgi:hypothetical protein
VLTGPTRKNTDQTTNSTGQNSLSQSSASTYNKKKRQPQERYGASPAFTDQLS